MKIRFVTGTDLISWGIRVARRLVYAPEAVLPDGTLLGAHLRGGVAIRRRGYGANDTPRELIVNIVTTHIRDARFHNFLYAQLGKPYDLRAVLGLALGRDWRDDGQSFCSELMAAALEYCGYLPPLSAVNNHISPRDLPLILSGLGVVVRDAGNSASKAAVLLRMASK